MKYFKYIMVILFLTTINFSLSAQITFSKSIKIEESNDYSQEVIEVNGYYYLSSSSLCFNNGVINTCFYFTKTDLEGNVVWQKKFENLETRLDNPGGFVTNLLKDNTFLLTVAVADEEYKFNPFLINIDFNGDTLWTKKIENEFWEVIWDAELLESGNLITFGTESYDNAEVHLVVRHISPNGEEILKKPVVNDCFVQRPNNMEWLDDEHLLIGHYCKPTYLDFYPMVTKIDTLGNVIWTEHREDLTAGYNQWIRQGMVQPLSDGGYVYPWGTPPDFFTYVTTIMAFDSTHQPVWELPLPQLYNDINTELYYVNRTANGDFIWTGALAGIVPGTEYTTCIGRLSSDGVSKWVRYYSFPEMTWDNYHPLYYITETSDGGLLAVGGRRDIDDQGETTPNTWLLKVDGEGCMTAGCTDEIIYFQNDSVIVDAKEVLFEEESFFLLSPNPASIETQVKFATSASTKDKTLKVFSIDGRLMKEAKMNGSKQTIELNLLNFPSGVYVVSLEVEGRILQRERLLKQ